ncbi:MAG: hypothetical protein QF786_15730, partial [Vicinamibacterales bacterium]|nr:hypothetical protein [Vicinamibacterales bacterium]
MPMKISDNTAISMPMRNLLAIVGAVAIGVYAFFGVIERLNKLETSGTLLEKDLEQVTKTLSGDIEKNNEFRIKWPRGELGSLPADSEQFMLIEHMAGQIEKIQIAIEEGMHNKVNIEFLQNQLEKLQKTVEKIQEEHRRFKVENG